MATKKPSADTLKLKNIKHRALTLAATAFAGESYGEYAYVSHLVDTGDQVRRALNDVELESTLSVLQSSAYLHDFIEDIDSAAYYTLKVQFGSALADIVWALSGFGRSRTERIINKFEKITKLPVAYLILVCDRVSNIKHAVNEGDKNKIAMYMDEHLEFVNRSEALISAIGNVSTRTEGGLLDSIVGSDRLTEWLEFYMVTAKPVYDARQKRKAREAKNGSTKAKKSSGSSVKFG